MSTRVGWCSSCDIFEFQPGRWYYLLEDSAAPRNGDWREFAICHGPYFSKEAAYGHLLRNYPLCGDSWFGWTCRPFDPDIDCRPFDPDIKPDELLIKLVAQDCGGNGRLDP